MQEKAQNHSKNINIGVKRNTRNKEINKNEVI
jgi:hypothetical protein